MEEQKVNEETVEEEPQEKPSTQFFFNEILGR